jgi:hypothetical protein
MVILELALKPEPLTVTWVPTRPKAGVMLIFCPVVKVAVAFLAAASWAFTVWSPLILGGTLKVAVKLPRVSVLINAGLVVTAMSSKVIATLELGVKSTPLTLTVSPTVPEVGTRVIADTPCVVKLVVADEIPRTEITFTPGVAQTGT